MGEGEEETWIGGGGDIILNLITKGMLPGMNF